MWSFIKNWHNWLIQRQLETDLDRLLNHMEEVARHASRWLCMADHDSYARHQVMMAVAGIEAGLVCLQKTLPLCRKGFQEKAGRRLRFMVALME